MSIQEIFSDAEAASAPNAFYGHRQPVVVITSFAGNSGCHPKNCRHPAMSSVIAGFASPVMGACH
jgi:hypothetical protein